MTSTKRGKKGEADGTLVGGETCSGEDDRRQGRFSEVQKWDPREMVMLWEVAAQQERQQLVGGEDFGCGVSLGHSCNGNLMVPKEKQGKYKVGKD